MIIQEMDLVIKHRNGKSNMNTATVSRVPCAAVGASNIQESSAHGTVLNAEDSSKVKQSPDRVVNICDGVSIPQCRLLCASACPSVLEQCEESEPAALSASCSQVVLE